VVLGLNKDDEPGGDITVHIPGLYNDLGNDSNGEGVHITVSISGLYNN
jgi:hypothetical protein